MVRDRVFFTRRYLFFCWISKEYQERWPRRLTSAGIQINPSAALSLRASWLRHPSRTLGKMCVGSLGRLRNQTSQAPGSTLGWKLMVTLPWLQRTEQFHVATLWKLLQNCVRGGALQRKVPLPFLYKLCFISIAYKRYKYDLYKITHLHTQAVSL